MTLIQGQTVSFKIPNGCKGVNFSFCGCGVQGEENEKNRYSFDIEIEQNSEDNRMCICFDDGKIIISGCGKEEYENIAIAFRQIADIMDELEVEGL